ncbi:MAG: hypothetical protein N6V49_00885 [Serratia symbiotica]|nr:hypothetical protein [Serratia symbiotica]
MAGLPSNNNSRVLQQWSSLFERRSGEHSAHAHALAHWQQLQSLGWPTALAATCCNRATVSSSPRWSTMPTSYLGRCWRRSMG